ncbi:partial putative signaling protein, partial [Rhodocyclaceae bacterium]
MNAPQPEGFDYTALLKPTDKVEFRRAGEIIFEMGQPGNVMYVIKSGKASIRVGDRIFDTVEKGATIGEMAILDGSPRSATAIAVTDCEIVAIEMTKSMVRRLRSMNYQAQYDLLTQLPNRTLFREHCINALRRARREEQLVGVLYLDLDHFENINDSLGYAAADTLLGQVASRLRSVLRDADTLARLGADEFAVLVEAVGDETELALTAQRMQEALAEPFEVDGKTLYLTASIGISCHPGEGSEVEILMKNADTAMHAAKDAGRNQYSFFSAALNARALEFLNLKTALREALGRNELLLYYQPRVALDTGAIHGVEALLRWQHPQMGMVSPALFIPIAEQAGYIEAIGDWVLQEGCRQQKAWLDAGLPAMRMAINLSALQMRQADLVDRVRHILAATGLPAEYLELEITESALVEDQDAVADKLRAFREMGIAIALDDFGTGYSAMSYLKKFPLDYMKIDQSF